MQLLPKSERIVRLCRKCESPLNPGIELVDDVCKKIQGEETIEFIPHCTCWAGHESYDHADPGDPFRYSVLALLHWGRDGELYVGPPVAGDFMSGQIIPGHLLKDSPALKSWVRIMVERKKPV